MKATQCTAILISFSLSAVAQTATPQIASTPPRCSAICRSLSTAIRSRLSSPISKHPADERSRGQIQIEFQAELPSGGPNRRLTLENFIRAELRRYRVNCLVPCDPDIRVVAQRRNDSQSIYQLDYVLAGVRSDSSLPGGRLIACPCARSRWFC